MTKSSSGRKGNVPGREGSANKGTNVESEKNVLRISNGGVGRSSQV